MSSLLRHLGLSNEKQIDFFNDLRRSLPWGVLGGLFVVLYSMDSHWSRYLLGFAILHFTGVLPTPPLFKFLYKIYCSEFGYKHIRPRLHARSVASHAEFFPAVRSLRKGNTLVCNSQNELSKVLRRFAESCLVVHGKTGDEQNQLNREENEDDVLIFPIPVLNDNYAYALIYPSSNEGNVDRGTSGGTTGNKSTISPSSVVRLNCVLIDAADPNRIILELERQLILAGLPTSSPSSSPASLKISLQITHVLTTHKHWDHAGGNKELFEMAQRYKKSLPTTAATALPASSEFLVIEPSLRKELAMAVDRIETERRRTERKRRNLAKLNKPKEEIPLRVSGGGEEAILNGDDNGDDEGKNNKRILAIDAPELSDDTDDENDLLAGGSKTARGSSRADLTVGTKFEDKIVTSKSPKKRESKADRIETDPYRYFFAEPDEERVRGLISFAIDLPFVGSKTDNPHFTNTFVSNHEEIKLFRDGSKSSSKHVATITVLDSPGHTCGSIMFLLSLSAKCEQSLFAAESEERKNPAASASTPQMSHSVYRALFTGDCIFCGGCGAMFETKTAADTLKTYDCFMGSTLTIHPLRAHLANKEENAHSSPNSTSSVDSTKGTAQEAMVNNRKRKEQSVTKNDSNSPMQQHSTIVSSASPESTFYVSSKNILMFVGHEYTVKLMGELMETVLGAKDKLIKKSEEEARKEIEEKKIKQGIIGGEESENNSGTKDNEPQSNAIDKWKEEKRRDISTVALEEILEDMAAKSGNHTKAKKKDKDGIPEKPTKVLPIRPHHAAIEQRWEQITNLFSTYHPSAATVPSTLFEERRTNPLLTLERSVLVKLLHTNAHASQIEEAVYGSDERRSKL